MRNAQPTHLLSRSCCFALLALLIAALPATAKRKDDVVIFKNGDRLTGEIKKLEHGQLFFSNDNLFETVQLDWAAIDQVTSLDNYIVELTTGSRLAGQIQKTAGPTLEASKLIIRTGEGELRVNKDDVVLVRPEEDTFLRQLAGSVDLGFSYTQGNNQKSLNFATSVRYLTSAYMVQVGGNSNFSQQSGGDVLDRREGLLNLEKYLNPSKWYVGGYVNVLSSAEQSLDLRTTLGAGLGYRPIVTNRKVWAIYFGAVSNRERFDVADNPDRQEAEALLGTDVSSFHFKHSEFNGSFRVFPSLTTRGRYRLNLTADYGIEVYRNLKWKLSLFETYDSDPPTTAKANDMGTTLSLGWTF